ncbi:FAD-dependent monooxygenase [Amaricoccus solimangrovi]|uniref:FAD-binding protein n=1 Tax=Amaricoccus solimangrovi TaxID=2589815 RepID=A0A501WY72_9RHOB|nr:FAD-dependent monooxygenase [Amaricoccus solimangrovi]TPE53692.1 FAD-binding protein [Amaricoccus solimangrovi]
MNGIDGDVLIAGGGVAGLSAAAILAARGFSVICADPVPPVTSPGAAGADPRSTAFLGPSVALLRGCGLWDRLGGEAAPLRVMRIVDAGGAAERRADFDAGELGAEPFGYNLPNWLLRREMVAHLEATPGARLLAPARVAGVVARADRAMVRLGDGESLSARLVIAADGRDSGLRAAAGIGARRWGYGQKGLVFTARHDRPHDGVSTEVHLTGGPFTLVPLPDDARGHRSAVVWMERGPRALELAAMPEQDFEAEMNARSAGVLGRLTLEGGRAVWPIVAQIADRLDAPRMALIAEAAHVVPPIGAQGLNMSLADIGTLADLLAAARDAGEDIGAPAVLARYHRARHGRVLARILGIDALNRAAMAEARPLRRLRRLGLGVLSGVPPLRHAAMRLGLG